MLLFKRTVLIGSMLNSKLLTIDSQHCSIYQLQCLLSSFLSTKVPTGPPQGLAVADRTTTSITLTWSDPAPDRINDRDGATGFEVRRNGQQVTTVTDRTYTFTGLSIATSYDFEVLAINDQGIAPDNYTAQLTASTASGGMQTL